MAVQTWEDKVRTLEGLWFGGAKFMACWNGNKGKKLQNLLLQNQVIQSKDGFQIPVGSVIKAVIVSKEIPNYSIVVVAPGNMDESVGADGDEVYVLNQKALELMRLFNLNPAKSSMTIPQPFTNYRKVAYKVIETLDEVMSMALIGDII
jgi:hypothetical protein